MNRDPDERPQPDGAAPDEFDAIVALWRNEGDVPQWPADLGPADLAPDGLLPDDEAPDATPKPDAAPRETAPLRRPRRPCRRAPTSPRRCPRTSTSSPRSRPRCPASARRRWSGSP